MPFVGVVLFALLTLAICGLAGIVALMGRRKNSRLLLGIGLAPIGITLAVVLLAVLENYLPLDSSARLHMSLPPEARVVRFESDMDRMEIVFRLPATGADGFDAERFQAIWRKNVGSYTYPCPGMGGSVTPAKGIACAWYGGDPDGGEKLLFFDARTRTYHYSAH